MSPSRLGAEFCVYPPNHIEVDNRLSWFLGRLDESYGRDAFYVHLLRSPREVARSYLSRGWRSILFSFASVTLQSYERVYEWSDEEQFEAALLYANSVGENIRQFLRDKPLSMTVALESARTDFTEFWKRIGAEGDLEAALAEWGVRHNATRAAVGAEWAHPYAEVTELKGKLRDCQEDLRECVDARASGDVKNRRLGQIIDIQQRSLESYEQIARDIEFSCFHLESRCAELRAAVSRSLSLLQLRRVVAAKVPVDAVVAVVSKGDDELAQIAGMCGWHFPGDEAGGYTWQYPTDSGEAIQCLQLAASKGVAFLVFPSFAFWWFEYYREFAQYLDGHCRQVWRDALCAIYDISHAG